MEKSERKQQDFDEKVGVGKVAKLNEIPPSVQRKRRGIFLPIILVLTFLYFLVKFLFGYMLVDLKNAPLQLLALRWEDDKMLVNTQTVIRNFEDLLNGTDIEERLAHRLQPFGVNSASAAGSYLLKNHPNINPIDLVIFDGIFKNDSQIDSFMMFYKIRFEFIRRGSVLNKNLKRGLAHGPNALISLSGDEFKQYNFLGKDEIEELFSGTFADLLNLFKLLKVEFHEFLESRKGGKSGYLSPKCLYVDIQKPHSDLKFSLLLKYLVGKIIDLLPGAKDSFFGPLADKEGFKGTVALTVEDVENSMRRLCLAKPVVGDTLIHNIFSVLFVFSFDKDDVDKMVDMIPYLKTLKDNYEKALGAANSSPTAIKTLKTAFESQKMLAFHHLYSLILTSLFKIDSEAYPYPAVAEKDPRSLLYRLFGISALKDKVKEIEQISDAFCKCWNHDASVRELIRWVDGIKTHTDFTSDGENPVNALKEQLGVKLKHLEAKRTPTDTEGDDGESKKGDAEKPKPSIRTSAGSSRTEADPKKQVSFRRASAD